MTKALLDLLRDGRISEKVALEYASNSADMRLKMDGIGKGAIVKERQTNDNVDIFEFKGEE